MLGKNCKYNGGNNYHEKTVEVIKGHDVFEVCPEVLGGLGVPRKCAEIVNGIVMAADGDSLDNGFRTGVEKAMELIEDKNIDLAILQPRSPSCGVKQIYDGTFSGKLMDGQGIFAEALIKKGIKVMDSEDIKVTCKNIQSN